MLYRKTGKREERIKNNTQGEKVRVRVRERERECGNKELENEMGGRDYVTDTRT